MTPNTATQADPVVTTLRAYLDQYERDHPGSRATVYRKGFASVYARIIDPGFRDLDRVERDELVWETLSALPEAVHQDLTVLLLLTDDELSTSFANLDFEQSIPHSL